MKCPYCGKESAGTVNFCIYCGKTMTQGSSAAKRQVVNNGSTTNKQNIGVNYATQNVKEPKEKKILIPIVIGLVVIVGVIVTLSVLKKRNSSEMADRDYDNSYSSDIGDTGKQDIGYDNDQVNLRKDESNDQTADREDNSNYDEDGVSDLSEINVEDEVSSIRDKYDSIMDGVLGSQYQTKSIDQGVTAYITGNLVKAIFVDKGYSGYEYSRRYYYDDDRLIFAYYEGNDAHRLYFKDNRLFRWRYASEATNAQDAVNHDMDDVDGYQQIEEYARNEGYSLLDKAVSSDESLKDSESEYVLPNSDSSFLTADDLRGLTKDECRIARNELYARHGRKFDDEYLAQYFSRYEWYHPTIDPDDFEESMLNDYEIANRDLIVQYEKDQGYR